jgi:hypothetical protein
MRCEEGYRVHFLECALGCEICFRRTGEEESRECVGGRVSNLIKALACNRTTRDLFILRPCHGGHQVLQPVDRRQVCR